MHPDPRVSRINTGINLRVWEVYEMPCMDFSLLKLEMDMECSA